MCPLVYRALWGNRKLIRQASDAWEKKNGEKHTFLCLNVLNESAILEE